MSDDKLKAYIDMFVQDENNIFTDIYFDYPEKSLKIFRIKNQSC